MKIWLKLTCRPSISIINGHGPVMVDNILQILLSFLPQKPIYFDWTHIPPFYFKKMPHFFNCLHRGRSYLYLLLWSTRNYHFIFDLIGKTLTINQNPILIQYLGNSIIGKHGKLTNIVKLPIPLSLKFRIDITYEYLRSFVEVNLMTFVDGVILEIGEIFS